MKRPQKPMKQINQKLGKRALPVRERSTTLVVRTERRSWFTIALTGFGAILLRYLKTVRERTWNKAVGLLLALVLPLFWSGCFEPRAQKGGGATSLISRPGHTNAVTLAQPENPNQPSRQMVQSEQTVEYILPAGTAIALGAGRSELGDRVEDRLSRTPDSGLPSSAPPAVAILASPTPVRCVTKDRTETSIGGAQKDTAREWAAKAASVQPVMWAGIAMMTVVAGVLVYFGWWTKAALALGIGVGMILLAQTLPAYGTAILLGGLGVFGLAALLVLYAYHKGQLDQNHNGITDFLERKEATNS
jgi:hypothetical protein